MARRNVSGARGGAPPLGVSLAEMDGAVLLAHDKSLLIFSILSRKLRPTPGEKERPTANAFPQQGYSLRLLTSGKGLIYTCLHMDSKTPGRFMYIQVVMLAQWPCPKIIWTAIFTVKFRPAES